MSNDGYELIACADAEELWNRLAPESPPRKAPSDFVYRVIEPITIPQEHIAFPPVQQFTKIVRHPDICMGEPTIDGTRITAAFIYRMIKSRMTIKEILEAYPQLVEEDIRQAVAFTDPMQRLQQAA